MVVIDNPPPSSTSDFLTEETSTKHQEAKKKTPNDVFYKTKTITFRGGTKNIILQNNNGPCPLIAICNVLLLRNDMNLHPIVHDEVSEDRLLVLVANSLIELNGFGFLFPSHDEEYISNQRKKISDAIDILPCLASGINIDVKFRRIDEFESTPELTTFELLKIPLFHGWIYDPKDSEIATAIGSKSYNDLITDLVVLKTRFPEAQSGQSSGESSVNFSESITSTLGVPSHRCSITTTAAEIDEGVDLLQALTLSKREALGFDICSEGESLSDFLSRDETLINSVDAAAVCSSAIGSNNRQESIFAYMFPSWESLDETVRDVLDRTYEEEEVRSTTSITKNSGDLDYVQKSSAELGDESVCDVETKNSLKMTDVHVTSPEKPVSIEETNVESTKNDNVSEISLKSEEVRSTTSITKSSGSLDHDQLSSTELGDESVCDVLTKNSRKMTDSHETSPEKPVSFEETNVESSKNDSIFEIPLKSDEVRSTTSITDISGALDHDQVSSTELGDESVRDVETESSRKMTDVHVTSPEKLISVEETNVESTKDDSLSEIPLMSEDETFLTPRSLIDVKGKAMVDDVTPYGAEECVFGSPFYEGESLLGESSSERKDTNVLTLGEGEVIVRFLRDNATQLTWHGLLKLKEDLTEDELCVLFRNNHFYTMLKHDNELYTLVTDLGYLLERDLVWERLDEINGDSVFITSDFKVLKSYYSSKSQARHHLDAFSDILDDVFGVE